MNSNSYRNVAAILQARMQQKLSVEGAVVSNTFTHNGHAESLNTCMHKEGSLFRHKSDVSLSTCNKRLEATPGQMTSVPNSPTYYNVKHSMDGKGRRLEKPPVRPKPAYLKQLFNVGAFVRRNRDNAWSRRIKIALVADLLQGRCKAANGVLTVFNGHFEKVLCSESMQLAVSHLPYRRICCFGFMRSTD